MKIRTILVDDHTMVREALCVVLEQDSRIQVVGEAGDGETALQLADKLSPDVVVMDVAMPGQSKAISICAMPSPRWSPTVCRIGRLD